MDVKIPEKFLAHLAPFIGDEEEQEAFRAALIRPLPKTLRANLLKQSPASWQEMAEELGLWLEPLPFVEHAYSYTSDKDAGKLLEHRMGFFYLQEAASMIPVEVLVRLSPDAERILDLCAAPGSKTTQIATSYPSSAHVVANEPSASRLSVLVANILRLGIGNVVCSNQDGRRIGEDLPDYFDAVLVDAPCSGEGTIRKDRQALRGWNRKRFKKIVRVQEELLESALAATTPGGTLVYSTCALSPEENQETAKSFLDRHAGEVELRNLGDVMPELSRSVTPEGFLWVAPHHYDTGGFFVAAFTRKGQKETPHDRGQENGGDPVPLNDRQLELAERFGLPPALLAGNLVHRGSTIYLQPSPAQALAQHLELNRPGIKLFETRAGQAHLHQEFALIFGASCQRGFIEVNRDQARHFLYGGALELHAGVLGAEPTILRYRGQPLGLAQTVDGRFRNLLGASFVQQSVD